jgi:hypothetical protein
MEEKEFTDFWAKKLKDFISAEIDQEIKVESGELDPDDAIDYRKQFKEEFGKAAREFYEQRAAENSH